MKYSQMRTKVSKAIKENKPGFRNGWISSSAVKELTGDIQNGSYLKILMEGFRRVPHPGLNRGRSAVRIDDKQPILYVTPDHYSEKLNSTREISQAYIEDQIDNL